MKVDGVVEYLGMGVTFGCDLPPSSIGEFALCKFPVWGMGLAMR